MIVDSKIEDTGVGFLSEACALEEGLRLGGAGVWRWKIDSAHLEWTRNLESIHHLPPGSFDGTLASFQRDLHPEDAADVWKKITTSIETGKPYRAVYRTTPRANAADVWIETSGGVTTSPDGCTYLTGVCLDVSARVRNELQLKRRLAQQSAVATFGTFALNEPDLTKVLDGAVHVAAEVLDVPLSKILQFDDTAEHLVLRSGIGWADGLVGQGTVGIESASQAGYTLLVAEPVLVHDLQTETRFDGPPLLYNHGVRSGISVVIPGTEVRPFGVFGIHSRELREFDHNDADFLQSLANIVAGAARQVTAVDREKLLVREMAHRAGNLLQLVNSIASQTFKSVEDTQLARKAFSERLSALARSNYVVSRGGWTSTRFAELVEESLKPFGDRIVMAGRDILLPPELSFDMGLILHELATNSVKYGTLGQNNGSVHIAWSYQQNTYGKQLFCFEWDDPQSKSEQTAKGTGFGSKLMGALVEQKWKGRLVLITNPHFCIKLEILCSV